ncbi:MAG: response regulator transcription factor [Ignavibacteriales bacterium]|nr:response regulator transcription factor [Ignavibacteriales bacterium]
MDRKTFNVLVVDDHSLVRKGIISLLQDDKNICDIYEADNAAAAIKLVKEKWPDLILMDISLPDDTGIEAIRHIRSLPDFPESTKFLIISIYDSPEYYYRAIKAGASGMISKSISPRELHEGIYKVLEGESYFGSNTSKDKISSIIEHFDRMNFENNDPETVYLTRREREVLILMFKGYRNKDIADLLCLSPHTVETHRKTFMSKLNVNSVSELHIVIKNSDKLTKLVESEFPITTELQEG